MFSPTASRSESGPSFAGRYPRGLLSSGPPNEETGRWCPVHRFSVCQCPYATPLLPPNQKAAHRFRAAASRGTNQVSRREARSPRLNRNCARLPDTFEKTAALKWRTDSRREASVTRPAASVDNLNDTTSASVQHRAVADYDVAILDVWPPMLNSRSGVAA